MAVPSTVVASAIAAVVDGFKDVTDGTFQTLATMSLNYNKRKVLIEQIKGDVRKYLANFDENLRKSMEVMNYLHEVYEKGLADSNLTFDEKRELLNDFVNHMLKIIARMIEHSLSSYQDPTDAHHHKTLVAINTILANHQLSI